MLRPDSSRLPSERKGPGESARFCVYMLMMLVLSVASAVAQNAPQIIGGWSPNRLIVASGFVYWTQSSNASCSRAYGIFASNSTGGRIQQLNLGPLLITCGDQGPSSMCKDGPGGRLFFLDPRVNKLRALDVGRATVADIALTGALSDSSSLAQDDGSVYWTDGIGIRKIAKTGGLITTIHALSLHEGTIDSDIVADSGFVYFQVGCESRKVRASGFGEQTIYAGVPGSCPQNPAVDSDQLYFTEWSSNGRFVIKYVSLNGGDARIAYASGWTVRSPVNLIIRKGVAYWIEPDRYSGTIRSLVFKDGLTLGVRTLATVRNPRSLQVDDTSVYWADDDSAKRVNISTTRPER